MVHIHTCSDIFKQLPPERLLQIRTSSPKWPAWECFSFPQHRVIVIKNKRPKLLRTHQVKRHLIAGVTSPWPFRGNEHFLRRPLRTLRQRKSDLSWAGERTRVLGRAAKRLRAAAAPPSSAWRMMLTQHAGGRPALLPATTLRHGLSVSWLR